MKGQPPQPYSIGIQSITKKPSLIPEAGCGQSPQKSVLWDVFIFVQKNQVMMNKESCSGYTINRKNIRQQEIHGIDSKNLHIELLSGKSNFP